MQVRENEKETGCIVYVHLPQMRNDEIKFKEIMKEYGVIKRCDSWNKEKMANWWLVEYSHQKEAKDACNSMRMKGMEARMSAPCPECNDISDDVSNGSTDQYESWQSNAQENTPLEKRMNMHSHEKIIKLTKLALIRHFLGHFMRHPKTTCGIPNLFWWILFYASLIAILVVSAKVADIFNWDIYRVSKFILVLLID